MLPVCYQISREQCLQQTANHAKSKTERDALLWLHQEPGIEHICMVKSSEAKRNSLKIFVKESSYCSDNSESSRNMKDIHTYWIAIFYSNSLILCNWCEGFRSSMNEILQHLHSITFESSDVIQHNLTGAGLKSEPQIMRSLDSKYMYFIDWINTHYGAALRVHTVLTDNHMLIITGHWWQLFCLVFKNRYISKWAQHVVTSI